MELLNEPPILHNLSPPPPAFMYKALHILGNTPLEAADQKLRHGLLTFALQALLDHPTTMVRIFMETRAIDAVSRQILAECSITPAGLQAVLAQCLSDNRGSLNLCSMECGEVELPGEICQLFLSVTWL